MNLRGVRDTIENESCVSSVERRRMTFNVSQAVAPRHPTERSDMRRKATLCHRRRTTSPVAAHRMSSPPQALCNVFAGRAYTHLSEPFPSAVVVMNRCTPAIASASTRGGGRNNRGSHAVKDSGAEWRGNEAL
jgi:hypothetical protein